MHTFENNEYNYKINLTSIQPGSQGNQQNNQMNDFGHEQVGSNE